MRIIIASTHVPFTHGGGNKIVEDLRDELIARGFQTEVVTIPFSSLWTDIPLQTVALRLFDLTEAGNRVNRLIAIRYPAYALRHPNKVAWFIHHHRGAYDLWNTEVGNMPDLPRGRHYRDMMRRSDGIYLRECRKLFMNSQVVANRVRRFNAIEPNGVLYPPLRRDHPFRPGDHGDYIYYVSRLEPIKRQTLAIEALAHAAPAVRLVISGASEQESYLDTLQALAVERGVADRVHFTGWVSEEKKAEWMAGCCAALYLAYDEDSYGYATLEAFHAAKPVITLTDSGGPLEVIEDGLNGSVVAPSPAALGEAMTRYWEDRPLARRRGLEAQQTPGRRRIDWDHVVENLTA